MNIIVTIPAYNEEKTLQEVLSDIKKVMSDKQYDYKILVVDDGSKDKTAEVAKNAGAIVVSHPMNYGLAEAFKTEMKKCLELGADIIVHTDADGQYRAEEIPNLIEEVKKGNDLVLGSRFMGKIESMSLMKRLGNIAFSRVISKISRLKITDAQTGFRAFKKEVAELKLISNYTYTQEQVIRAAKQKLKISEIPVYFRKRGKETKSRLMKGPLHYAARAGVNLLRIYRDYEPLKFFGYAGAFFIAIGVLLGGWITYNVITTGAAGGIPRVILSALALITGIQIFSFGFLADMNRR